MNRGQFQMQLSPLCGGSFTRLRVCGALPTALPARELARLTARLALWSGWPVQLALPVEGVTDAWFDFWTDAATRVPAHRLELRFTLTPRRRTAGHER